MMVNQTASCCGGEKAASPLPASSSDDGLEEAVWINGVPCPPAPPVRPLRALVSVARLIGNKEDTRQVFEVVEALAGHAGHRQFRRFTNAAYGRRVIAEPVRAEEILSNRDWLRSLPEGSLGRAYLDFMEGEDLTPEGLLASASEAGIDFEGETDFEDYRRVFLHQAVLHDVLHVLSGYGRDALGELCNLAFTLGQFDNRGFKLIIAIGLVAQKLEAPGQPLAKAIRQGMRMGRESAFVFGYDIEEIFPQPLDKVRRTLNILEPTVYNAVPQSVKDGLLKPKTTKTQTEREAGLSVGA